MAGSWLRPLTEPIRDVPLNVGFCGKPTTAQLDLLRPPGLLHLASKGSRKRIDQFCEQPRVPSALLERIETANSDQWLASETENPLKRGFTTVTNYVVL